MSLKYPHSNLHFRCLRCLGSKVDNLLFFFFFTSCRPTFASQKWINDKIPEEGLLQTGKSKERKKRVLSKPWLLTARDEAGPLILFTSITQPSQLDAFLICLFSAISFSSSLNDPGGLAGIEWCRGSQDLRSEGKDPRPSCWIPDCTWASRCVCVYACVLQQGVVSGRRPDTGVSFRGCLENEAEMKPLTSENTWLQGGYPRESQATG